MPLGNTHFLKPDTTYLSVSLSSISKEYELGSAPRMIRDWWGFESLDNPDFSISLQAGYVFN